MTTPRGGGRSRSGGASRTPRTPPGTRPEGQGDKWKGIENQPTEVSKPPAGSQMGMPVRPEDRMPDSLRDRKKKPPTLEKLTAKVPTQTYGAKLPRQKPQSDAEYEKSENERALANRQPGETDDPTTASDGISDAARDTLKDRDTGLY
jgi:hypothetical protein